MGLFSKAWFRETQSWAFHAFGLKVVVPSTPFDAKGLLLASIRDKNPVVFLEPKWLYRQAVEEVPLGDYEVPLGKARIVSNLPAKQKRKKKSRKKNPGIFFFIIVSLWRTNFSPKSWRGELFLAFRIAIDQSTWFAYVDAQHFMSAIISQENE